MCVCVCVCAPPSPPPPPPPPASCPIVRKPARPSLPASLKCAVGYNRLLPPKFTTPQQQWLSQQSLCCSSVPLTDHPRLPDHPGACGETLCQRSLTAVEPRCTVKSHFSPGLHNTRLLGRLPGVAVRHFDLSALQWWCSLAVDCVRLESGRSRVRIPLAPGFFRGRVIPVT